MTDQYRPGYPVSRTEALAISRDILTRAEQARERADISNEKIAIWKAADAESAELERKIAEQQEEIERLRTHNAELKQRLVEAGQTMERQNDEIRKLRQPIDDAD